MYEEVTRTIRTLMKPAAVAQSSTDKLNGFLLLNARKEVVVLTKRLLELCPAVIQSTATTEPTPAQASQGKAVIDRLLYNSAVAALATSIQGLDIGGVTPSPSIAVARAMVDLGASGDSPKP